VASVAKVVVVLRKARCIFLEAHVFLLAASWCPGRALDGWIRKEAVVTCRTESRVVLSFWGIIWKRTELSSVIDGRVPIVACLPFWRGVPGERAQLQIVESL